MPKRYEHVGAVPIVVGGYGRVIPGTKFSCEMDPVEEVFLVRIRAIQVLESLPEDAILDPAPKDTATFPDSWPRTPVETKAERLAAAEKGGK